MREVAKVPLTQVSPLIRGDRGVGGSEGLTVHWECLIIVDLRINKTRQTGEVRKTKLPFYRLVGAVSNCADSVRGETAPTGGRKCVFIF